MGAAAQFPGYQDMLREERARMMLDPNAGMMRTQPAISAPVGAEDAAAGAAGAFGSQQDFMRGAPALGEPQKVPEGLQSLFAQRATGNPMMAFTPAQMAGGAEAPPTSQMDAQRQMEAMRGMYGYPQMPSFMPQQQPAPAMSAKGATSGGPSGGQSSMNPMGSRPRTPLPSMPRSAPRSSKGAGGGRGQNYSGSLAQFLMNRQQGR